jgi:predicted ATPase
MNIETIRVKNFKALRELDLWELPAYCVVVGKKAPVRQRGSGCLLP